MSESGWLEAYLCDPKMAFYPQVFQGTQTKKTESDKDRADRYEKALKQMRDLPLPQRVSYVYMGIIEEALQPKESK